MNIYTCGRLLLFFVGLSSFQGLSYGASAQNAEFRRKRDEQLMQEEKDRFEAIQKERRCAEQEAQEERKHLERLQREERLMREEKARYEALQKAREEEVLQDGANKKEAERLRREERMMREEKARYEALQKVREEERRQDEADKREEEVLARKQKEAAKERAEKVRLAAALEAERIRQAELQKQREEAARRKQSGQANASSSNAHGFKNSDVSIQSFMHAAQRGDHRALADLIAKGMPLETKDNFGNTALHWLCRMGHLEAVKYLLSVGADCGARNNVGITPLYEAWYMSRYSVIEFFTGLKVAKDAFGELRPIWNSDQASSSTSRVDWKRLLCSDHVGELSGQEAAIAQAVAFALKVEDIYFYQTSKNSSFASHYLIDRIGISKECMSHARYSVFGIDYKPLSYSAVDFKSMLYHEVCHIRGKHTGMLRLKQLAAGSNYALSQEMEAELGAMYYLFKIDGVACFVNYLDDKQHPSNNEHRRYIGHLYDALLKNPGADFTLVENLVASYLKEKETGAQQLPDITERIRQELKGRSKSMLAHNIWVLS